VLTSGPGTRFAGGAHLRYGRDGVGRAPLVYPGLHLIQITPGHGLPGGEPAQRRDLDALVGVAGNVRSQERGFSAQQIAADPGFLVHQVVGEFPAGS
jgi:hypothetical protein